MASKLLPVQMLWVGGPMTTLERLALNSWMRQGHEVHLYTYGKPASVPKGLVIRDAGEILPWPSEEGSAAAIAFADRFRAKLLHERGGIWCDIDLVCVKPLEFAQGMDYFFASETLPPQPGDDKPRIRANNCLMKTPAQSPVMYECFGNPESGGTGPLRLHAALEKFNLLGALLNPNVACPVPFWNLQALVAGIATLPPESCAVHCWSESWRRNFLDRDGEFETHCLYERLKTHYLGARKGAS